MLELLGTFCTAGIQALEWYRRHQKAADRRNPLGGSAPDRNLRYKSQGQKDHSFSDARQYSETAGYPLRWRGRHPSIWRRPFAGGSGAHTFDCQHLLPMARAGPCPNQRLLERLEYARCGSCQPLRICRCIQLSSRLCGRAAVRDFWLGRQDRGVHGFTIRWAPDAASEN